MKPRSGPSRTDDRVDGRAGSHEGFTVDNLRRVSIPPVPFDSLTEGTVKYLLLVYLDETWEAQPGERQEVYWAKSKRQKSCAAATSGAIHCTRRRRRRVSGCGRQAPPDRWPVRRDARASRRVYAHRRREPRRGDCLRGPRPSGARRYHRGPSGPGGPAGVAPRSSSHMRSTRREQPAVAPELKITEGY